MPFGADDRPVPRGSAVAVHVRCPSAKTRRWLSSMLWQIKTTLTHGHGGAALLRRLLADQQVSPTKLAFVPRLIETAIGQIRAIGIHLFCGPSPLHATRIVLNHSLD